MMRRLAIMATSIMTDLIPVYILLLSTFVSTCPDFVDLVFLEVSWTHYIYELVF